MNINNIRVPDNFNGACVRVLTSWGYSPDDAIQEGLVKLFDVSLLGKKMDDVTSYIARALKNQEIRRYQQRINATPLVSFEACGEIVGTCDKVSSNFEAMIVGLEEKEKQLLRDCHIEGLKYQELAGKWAVPIGTIRSRLNRLHKRLKDANRKP